MRVKCDYCGIEFSKKLSRVKRSKNHFCNRECYDKFKEGKSPTNIKIIPKENMTITQPKILYFDIETTNLGADFGEMLMYAYCWHNEPENVKVVSVLDYEKSFELPIEQRDKYLLPGLINLINEADEVVAHYGSKFDCKFVQTRAIINDIPIADIRWSKIFDTCITARKQLKFQSNRLANIAEALGLDVRKSHLDKKIWRRANAYDIDAIIEMIDYCKQDVIVLYQIAQKIRPTTKHLTSMKVLTNSENMICYCCGSENLISKDFYLTKINKYTRYQCNNCGAWQRSSKPVTKNTTERTMY